MADVYKIICHEPGGRVVADLSPDGTLTIHHDHFSDEDNINIGRIIDALDKWSVRRTVCHLSKKGLNKATVDSLNDMQEVKPGKVLFDFEPLGN